MERKNNFSLVLNSSNVIGNGNNTYQYNFLAGSMSIPENANISVSSATIPYSWRNITASQSNNTFSLYWPLGAGISTFNVVLPDGFYTVPSLQAYIEQFCITNGLYLINGSGSYVYYMNLSVNPTYYAVQIVEALIPISLPSGWSLPSNFIGFPTVSKTMGINISAGLGSIIGYTAGNYPSTQVATTSQSFLSNTLVNATPVNSLVLRCSLVSNNVIFPSDILDSIPINATYGSNIIYDPSFEKVVRIKKGTYSNFQVVICDQNNNLVSALDPNLLINLRIEF